MRGWALLAALLLPYPAPAQEAAPAAECELHVWPAQEMARVRQRGIEPTINSAGLLPALIDQIAISAAEKADKRAKERLESLAEPLPTARQAEILTALPLPAMLRLPSYRLIVHDSPLDSRTIRTVKTRYVETAAPCYADLVLDDVVYSREYARGQNLKTFFRFRDFAAGAAPVRSFGTWVQTKLLIFSIDPPNLSDAALEEIASALRNNARLFSDLLAKRP